MKYQCTLTDTFSGELNYSWVRRTTIEAPHDASVALVVRRAKRALGLTGRHRVEAYQDDLILRFPRACVALVIEPVWFAVEM